MGIFSSRENDESKIEKEFPSYAEGEQRHSQYEDLLVGKSPKIGEKQKPIEVTKASFGPNAPKTSVKQSAKDQSYEEANKGGEHIGNVFQLSSDNNKLLVQDKNSLDFNSRVSDNSENNEQELTDEDIKVLEEINNYLAGLD